MTCSKRNKITVNGVFLSTYQFCWFSLIYILQGPMLKRRPGPREMIQIGGGALATHLFSTLEEYEQITITKKYKYTLLHIHIQIRGSALTTHLFSALEIHVMHTCKIYKCKKKLQIHIVTDTYTNCRGRFSHPPAFNSRSTYRHVIVQISTPTNTHDYKYKYKLKQALSPPTCSQV